MPCAEAEWYNTEFHASQLAGMLPYSNCLSQGHSTLFPKCKMHSCYIPQQSRFVTLYSYPTIPSGSASRFNHGPPVYIRVIHLTTV